MKKNADELDPEEILRSVLDTIPIRVFWKDLDSVFCGGNHAFLQDMQLDSINELVGKNDADFFPDKNIVDAFRKDDLEVIHSAKPKIGIEEPLILEGQPDKWLKTNKVPMLNENGNVIGVLATYEEITEQVQYRKEIEKQAMIDALTGIANRRKLQKYIEEYPGTHAGLLFIDLESFKAVNDSLGHSIGDAVLQEVAKRLHNLSGYNDMLVARLGGDEFSVFVPLTSIDNIQERLAKLASSIIQELVEPFIIEHQTINIGASIGIAIIDTSEDDLANAFRKADMAMYSAKESGTESYQFFDKKMREDADRKHQLAYHLRGAIDNNEFSLVYQPQFDQDRKLIGAEALLRWNNRDLGFVPPDEFIPLAEETGLIHDIGNWVLNASLDALKTWTSILNRNPEFKLAVNYSSKQFQIVRLPEIIEEAITSRQLNPKNLQVEITESVLIDYKDRAIRSMLKMQKIGISIAIDDFGTGYSSLSYLAMLPIDKLKIDRSFVTDLHKKSTNKKLVETLINMSKNLQMEVIAEGVENIEEKNVLVELGCFQFQGFYFSKPITEQDFTSIYVK